MFSVCKSLYSWEGGGDPRGTLPPFCCVLSRLKQNPKTIELRKSRLFPSPLYHQASGPQGKLLGGRESFVDILHKPKQEGERMEIKGKPKPIKIRVYSYVHKVRAGEGLLGNRVCVVEGQYVCKCHMCMCAYTACVTQLSTEVYRPGSPKCNLPLG